MTCLGDVVAALVDGELDHAARERAQRHLAHCAGCRAEVDVQRRLKTRLTTVGGDPAPSDALTARLLGLLEPVAPLPRPAHPASPPRAVHPPHPAAAVRPVTLRPGPARPGTGPYGGRPGASRRRRRAVVGSALAALGIGAALALGSPPTTRPSTPVDPGTDAFVVDFVSTTTGSGGAGGRR